MLEDAKLLDEDLEETVNRSWGTSITVNGEVWATSLFWQPLQNKEDPLSEVSEAAEGILEGADLYAIKGGKAPQFGICVSSEGYKQGEQAAAVTLATSLGDKSSFVAVFKVDEGWWYTCIRNDIILSDGDMLFLDEEEAKSQFLSMMAVPDWGKKIAPPEWGIEETEYPSLEQIMQRGLRSRLQKIKGLRGPKFMIIVGVSAIVGLWLLYSIFDAIFLAPPKGPLIVPIAPKTVQPVEKPPEIKPWETIVDPIEVLKQCHAKVGELVKILPPGWRLGDITCTPSGAATSWTREVGRVSWISKALDVSGIAFSGRSVSDDGNNMVASVPLETIQKHFSPPQMSVVDLKNTINDLFQAIGQPVTLSNETLTSVEGSVYRRIIFKFTSSHNPLVWSDLLTKFSALDIIMVKYNVGTENWEYEGAIYAL